MFRTGSIILIFLAACAAQAAQIILPPTAWSGDGSRIAVAYRIGERYGIYIFDRNGRQSGYINFNEDIVAMKCPTGDGPIAILACHSDRRHYLWLANTSGIINRLPSRSVYVPKTVSANLFSWSPDSRSIAFASDSGGNVDIWRINIGSGRQQRLTDTKGRDFEPVWSPDGKSIAFTSARSGSLGIWVTPADGGSARKIIDGSADEQHPAWSPDSKKISFLRVGRQPGIYTIPIAGGNAKPIAVGGRCYMAPVWSSTGKWIAFVYGRNVANVFATNVAKTKGWGPNYQTSFDRLPNEATCFRVPVWSSVRDQLVYATHEDDRLSIRIATLSEKHGPVVTEVYSALPARIKRS